MGNKHGKLKKDKKRGKRASTDESSAKQPAARAASSQGQSQKEAPKEATPAPAPLKVKSESEQINSADAIPPPAPADISMSLDVDLDELVKATHFSRSDIELIRNHLQPILGDGDMSMSKEQFEETLAVSSSLYTDRVFAVFCSENSNKISFSNLVKALSLLSHKSSLEEKYKLSFKLLDLEGKGRITKENTVKLLKSCLQNFQEKDSRIVLSDDQIQQLVERTFEETAGNKNGIVGEKEFSDIRSNHLTWCNLLTVDIPGVISRLEKRGSSLSGANETLDVQN